MARRSDSGITGRGSRSRKGAIGANEVAHAAPDGYTIPGYSEGHRSPLVPELPAIAEAGVEGRDAGYRFAACAPKWREIISKAGIEKE